MKKIYAVRKGRVPGVYVKWEDCERQVKKYAGAEFKAFEYNDISDFRAVYAIAEAYVAGKDAGKDSEKDANGSASKGVIYEYEEYEKKEGVYEEDVVAFVDGSNKEGITSYATIIFHNGLMEHFEAKVIDDLGMSQAAGEYSAAAAAIDYCVAENTKECFWCLIIVKSGCFVPGNTNQKTSINMA